MVVKLRRVSGREPMNKDILTYLVASFSLVMCSLGVSAQECRNHGEALTDFGRVQPTQVILSRNKSQDELRSPLPGTPVRYYMLRLTASGTISADWRLSIRDSDFRIIDTLGPAEFQNAPLDGRWTGRLVSTSINFDLYLGPGAEDVKIAVADALVMPSSVETPRYSTQVPGRPTYSLLFDYKGSTPEQTQRVRRLGDRVGFLIGFGPDPSGTIKSWCCSGVNLTSDLVLTNWHCGAPERSRSDAYWHSTFCRKVLVDMSWDGDQNGREFNCSVVEASSENLDYAVIRIAPALASAARIAASAPLAIASAPVNGGDRIRIVHHPECKAKQVSQNCTVRDATHPNWHHDKTTPPPPATDFTHDCDTEGGSSGAPVFTQSGALAGLHHLGFGKTPDGQCDKKNKAVHIQAILSDIKISKPALYDEITSKVSQK